jgi:hypothetical protein
MDNKDNILPWPIDYDRRPGSVRPISPSLLSRHLDDPQDTINLYDTLEERQKIGRILEELHNHHVRVIRAWNFVLWFIIGIFLVALIIVVL